MNIKNLLELLNENKSIVVIVPNKNEQKLLRDRIIFYVKSNVKLIDDLTIIIDASIIKILYPEVLFPYNKASTIIVEFSNSIPKPVLNNLYCKNLIFCNGEIS